MLSPKIGCVVGSDVAKSTHVVCALEAPSGARRLKSTAIPATAAGHAQLLDWLRGWGEPARLLIGLASTGSLWEPLDDALTQAGHAVVLLNAHQTASWATSLGVRAKTAGLDAHTLARGRLAGWPAGRLGAGEHRARRDRPGVAYAHPGAARPGREPECRAPAPARRAGAGRPRSGRPPARARRPGRPSGAAPVERF
jgi:transposase